MVLTTSWDDGHPSDEELGAALCKHGLAGTFFVPIRNREGRPVLVGSALRRLAERFEIGAHTLDHTRLTNLDPVGAAAQIRGGKDALEQLLGQPVEGFCYPGGKFDRRIQDSVREAGFRYARTVENFRTDSGTDPYRVPTTLQCYPHSRWTLAWNYLRYGAATVRWPAFRTAFLATDWTDRVRQLAATLTGTNAVLHLWGHSWEIEALGLWREVDELLAYLASLRPKVAEVGQIVPNLS